MLDSEHQTTVETRNRKTGLVVALAVVVLAAAGAGTWLLVRGGEKTPTDVIQDFAAAMRADDMESVEGFAGSDDVGFIEWLIGMKAEPVLTDCVENNTYVSCDVTFGDEFFYSVVDGETKTSTLGGFVRDGVFEGDSWPPPAGLATTEASLRTFVQEVHPELEDQMFGNDYAGVRMDRTSGELRMQVLDEYLAWRGA